MHLLISLDFDVIPLFTICWYLRQDLMLCMTFHEKPVWTEGMPLPRWAKWSFSRISSTKIKVRAPIWNLPIYRLPQLWITLVCDVFPMLLHLQNAISPLILDRFQHVIPLPISTFYKQPISATKSLIALITTGLLMSRDTHVTFMALYLQESCILAD